MNIKEFLIENGVDYTLYKLTQIDLDDILILDKSITQKVEPKFFQVLESERERDIEPKKIELSRSHKFKKNDFKIGQHIYYAIEPDTIEYSECKTCDGHGEVPCENCQGRGEVVCPHCKGKTQLTIVETKKRDKLVNCEVCKGARQFEQNCSLCKGQKQVKVYPNCQTCNGTGFTMQNSPYGSSTPGQGVKGGPPIGNNVNKVKQVCKTCQGRRKVEEIKVCPQCQGKGSFTINCKRCHGKGTYNTLETYQETKIVPCQACQQNGRVTCRFCKGAQSISCKTCRGERKTYQFVQNKFTLTVKDKPTLLQFGKNVNYDGLKALSQEPRYTIKKISEKENQLLLEYSKNNTIKITPDIITRRRGKIYKLTSESGISYYIWYSNFSEEYYYYELPPKDSFGVKISDTFKKVERIGSKLLSKGKSFWNKITNKNDY